MRTVLLTRANFSGANALHIYRALLGFLHSHVLTSGVVGNSPGALEPHDEDGRPWEALLAGGPVGQDAR
jgi:hypothetical protein